ncbi:MAG: biotin carboxyl carrier domain-containing protein [Acidobacteria bacterium]|nr:MAG: biotin carboxyl carrier domain-containing protein [Acidobacteriota bacterium]
MRAGPTWSAFEYGQTFAELAPHAPERTESSAEPERDSGGWFSVVSPTHGTFYRRPSPDAPPYVEVGKRIASGDIVGLVEVMKCFSPIRFDPPEGASAGIVREILAADGAEVQADQPLLRVELAP